MALSTRTAASNHTLPLFFSTDYLASAIDFDTIRKPEWIVESLTERPMAGVALTSPAPLTMTELAAVHDAAYVRAVQSGEPRDLARSSGLGWDAGLWTSVCASNGGAVAAARHALRTGAHAGSLSSGLHHAKRDHGESFCTFNGLAIAARAAIDEGATRVVVLDLDAHCGGGTASIVSSWPEVTQIDVTVSLVDRYRPSARQTLSVVRQASDYLATIAHALDQAPAPCDLVLYNAGMDPHEDSIIGGLRGITSEMLAERERLVFAWARRRRIPVAFVLAGGYPARGSLARRWPTCIG